MKTSVIIVAALSIVSAVYAGPDESKDISFISVGAPEAQSDTALAAHWQKLDEKRRQEIEAFLVMRLGLSSTGDIRLLGAYRETGEAGGKDKTLFHLQQLDLMGTRLFWSVLVDPDAATALVLYHVNAGLVTHEPLSFGGR